MRFIVAGLVLAACAPAVAGCGGSGGSSSSGDPSATHGGTLTLLTSTRVGDLDLDPGRASGATAAEVLGVVDRTLYAYAAAKGGGAEPLPDVASALPTVAPDRRTVTIRLRPDVKFAPPVSRRVVAADVVYAITRALDPAAGNASAARRFGSLRGLAAFRSGDAKAIGGLQAPDTHTLVLELTRPVGDRLMPALTSLATAPVPPEFAGKFDRSAPSAYDRHQIATGPYMIPADRLGKLTGVDAATRTLTLVRNPNWEAATDFRAAYVDVITVQTVRDTARAARRVAKGQGLLGELPALVRSPDVHVKAAAGGRDGWDLAGAWIDAT